MLKPSELLLTFSGLPESLSGGEGLSPAGMPIEVIFGRMSKVEQAAAWKWRTLFAMTKDIKILKVEKDGEDGVLVTFSDGTLAGYVVDELLLLRPIREVVKEPVDSD